MDTNGIDDVRGKKNRLLEPKEQLKQYRAPIHFPISILPKGAGAGLNLPGRREESWQIEEKSHHIAFLESIFNRSKKKFCHRRNDPMKPG